MTDSNSNARSVSEATSYLSTLERAIRDVGRELTHVHPVLHESIERLWEGYIFAYAYAVSRIHARRYAHHTSLDPFAVARVNPARITRTVEQDGYPEQARSENIFPTPKFKYAGTVRDGDWDRGGMCFEDTELYRSFEAHFERGVDWEETPFFETVVELIEAGTVMWGCSSQEEFERRCVRIDDLHQTIATHGYHSQAELSAQGIEDPAGCESSRIVRLVNHEMTVAVGRDGGLLFVDGRNRLAIAKVLDLDSIPVWIPVRHAQWQQYRERLATDPSQCSDLPYRLRTHPDLTEICSDETD